MIDLEARFAALERTVRLQRLALVAVILVGGVVITAGAISRPTVVDEVRTKRLVIENAQGKQVGEFVSGENGGAVLTLDSKIGDSRRMVQLTASESECVVSAGFDGSLQGMHLNKETSMYVNKGGNGDAIVATAGGDFSSIRIEHKDTKQPSAVMASSPKTGPMLILRDSSGAPIWSAPK